MLNLKDVNLNTKTKPNKNLIIFCNLLTYCNLLTKRLRGTKAGHNQCPEEKIRSTFNSKRKGKNTCFVLALSSYNVSCIMALTV